MRKLKLISLFVFLYTNTVFAQKNITPRAKNLLEKSFLQARNNQYYPAIASLKTATSISPAFFDAYTRLAELQYRTNQITEAINNMYIATSINNNFGIGAVKNLCATMAAYNDYDKAFLLIQKIKTIPFSNPNDKTALQLLDSQYSFANEMLQQPVPFAPNNLGDSINTAKNENFPSISLDGNTLVFTGIEKGINEDFFISQKDTCGVWSKAKNIGKPVNTSNADGAASLSTDGKYLFYTRCDSKSDNGWDGGGCDIYYSYKVQDTVWSSPEKFGATINSPNYEGQACLSSNNKNLYFVSNRDGGFGGNDIWISTYKDGLWQEPINAGASINTSGNENAPFIHADNETLYFSSNGKLGMGGYDVFMAKKINDSTFTEAKNIGYPINTAQNENAIVVIADGKTAYMASDRLNGKGQNDIYTFALYPAIQPIATHCIYGKVIDKFSKAEQKSSRIRLYNGYNVLLNTFTSNIGDASFAIPLHAGSSYKLGVQQESYKSYLKTIDLRQTDSLPANIFSPILLKQADIIDTIFQKKYVANPLLVDTNLVFIKNNYNYWHTNTDDSIIVNVQYSYNEKRDSALLQEMCMDSTLQAFYFAQLDTFYTQQKAHCITFINNYKTQLLSLGIADYNIHFTPLEAYLADDKMPLKIKVEVVEFY